MLTPSNALTHTGKKMKPLSIYREKSEQCLLQAEAMTDPAARTAMLDAAREWQLLVDLIESLSIPKIGLDDESSH